MTDPHLTGIVEVHGWVPTGRLTVDDVARIDLNVPFEIVDGRLEFMALPTPWHQHTVRRVQRLLEPHYPHVTGGVPVAVGADVRHPDVVALTVPTEHVLRAATVLAVRDIAVIAEVILHQPDGLHDRDSVTRDRHDKLQKYAQAAVPRYWIVDEDPTDATDAIVEVHRLSNANYTRLLTARLSDLEADAATLPGD